MAPTPSPVPGLPTSFDQPGDHACRVPLRWGDMDAQGHVNNALYVDYLQEARADFLAHGPNAHLLGGGVVVVRQSVEYKRPITFSEEPLLVHLRVVEVGAARFQIAYELFHGGELCATALTVLCPFDFTLRQPRRLGPEERAWFASVCGPMPERRALVAPPLRGRGHEHPLKVRWSDLDPYNHVNNVRYFDFVQEARIAMTTTADPSTARAGTEAPAAFVGPDDEPQMWLVARQDVDHVVQMDHRIEPYVVRTAPVAIGTSSSTFAAEIVDPTRGDEASGGLVLARARTVLVCADLTGRPQPLAAHTRRALEGSLVTQ